MSLGPLRTALVTGGARGIGLAIGRALFDSGCQVVLTDVDEEALNVAVQALDSTGERVMGRPLDVTKPSAWARVIQEVGELWGPIDILINNAGIMVIGEYLEVELPLDERQMNINVWGVLHGQRAVLPEMLRRGRGHVVNIASAAGQVGVPYAAVYSATKFAVVGVTEAVAYEYRDTGVHFSVVCPSVVDTDLVAGTRHPRWPPMATPEDVARGVIRAIRKRKELVFVPRAARLSSLLPAILPRSITRRVAEFLKMGDMFNQVDPEARAGYRARVGSEKDDESV